MEFTLFDTIRFQNVLNFSCVSLHFLITLYNFIFICKMDILKKLQNARPNKPYRGFGKLTIGYHEIKDFRIVKNKFAKKNDPIAKSVLIELSEEVLFLPQHFSKLLNEDAVQQLNSTIKNGESVYIYFGGKEQKSK